MSENPFDPPHATGFSQGRRLDTQLTPVLKFGAATFAASMAVLFAARLIYGRVPVLGGGESIIGIGMGFCMGLMLTLYFFQLRTILAGDDHLIIGGEHSDIKVPYTAIREIRIQEGFYYEVDLRLDKGTPAGSRVVFFFPIRLAEKVEHQPEFQFLVEKCPQLREKSRRSFWTRSLRLTRSAQLDTNWSGNNVEP